MRPFLACLIALFFASAHAQTVAEPVLSARAWLLMDAASGQVLAAHEADTRLEPASLTKVMTTYLVAEALAGKTLSPQQPVTISERAWRTQGSRSFIPVGGQVSVDDLFKGMVIQSGNDAAVALAEAIGGSEEAFAAMMNRTAQRLGLKDTRFLNASGYFEGPQPGHYSTARDLARLAAALLRDHPEAHRLHAVKEYTYAGIRQYNRNRLLWLDPSVDGLKTGHSEAAGFCLIATAQRSPRRLISVVLGAPSDEARARDSLNLLNWGFSAFEPVRLYAKGQEISRLKVYKGAENTVKAGFSQDFIVSVPRGMAGKLAARLDSRQPLLAPVQAGAVIGTLKLTLSDQPFGEYPVPALEDVPLAGWFGRLWDTLLLWFR
ncbi:MAG: peptidase [Betaproteobacteria bacterium HGW-Betaproteobacteria-11]|nr:MAG: peptidase [Betaproteobacteria bacterium HGW-Betaproteobacteria-11]